MKFLKSKLTFVSFFVIFILTCSLLFAVSQIFRVSRIELITEEENIKLLGIENYYERNLLLLSQEEIDKTLKENNPGVKELQVKKIFPNTLKIHAVFDKALSVLQVDRGFFILSPGGKILMKAKQKPNGLSLISYYQKLHYSAYQTGDVIDLKDIMTALYFLKKSTGLGLKDARIDISGFNMIRLQVENKMILFTTEKDMVKQSYELETLIRQFKIEGRDFKTLDFRFDKPIVTLK